MMNSPTTDYVRFPEMIAAPHYMQNSSHPSEVYMNISLFPFNTINKCLATKSYTYCVVPEGYHAMLVPERDYRILTKRINLTENLPCSTEGMQKMIKPSSTENTGEKQAEKPRRPPNPFFLFRKDKQASVFAQNRGISNLEVSKVVGRMWKSASFQEKEYYQKLAEEFKKEHQEKYPNYKYSPVKQKRKCKKNDRDFSVKRARYSEPPVSEDTAPICFSITGNDTLLVQEPNGYLPPLVVPTNEMPFNAIQEAQEFEVVTDLDSPIFSENVFSNGVIWPYHNLSYYEQSTCSFEQLNMGGYTPETTKLTSSQGYCDPHLMPHQYFQD